MADSVKESTDKVPSRLFARRCDTASERLTHGPSSLSKAASRFRTKHPVGSASARSRQRGAALTGPRERHNRAVFPYPWVAAGRASCSYHQSDHSAWVVLRAVALKLRRSRGLASAMSSTGRR